MISSQLQTKQCCTMLDRSEKMEWKNDRKKKKRVCEKFRFRNSVVSHRHGLCAYLRIGNVYLPEFLLFFSLCLFHSLQFCNSPELFQSFDTTVGVCQCRVSCWQLFWYNLSWCYCALLRTSALYCNRAVACVHECMCMNVCACVCVCMCVCVCVCVCMHVCVRTYV